MSTQEKIPFRERSTFLRFDRWLFDRRRVRRILISLAWIATLIALFYAEEDWRGHRAWNLERRQLEAQGTPVDLKSIVPKPVPDEQNFAMTPLLAPLFDFLPGTQQTRDTNAVNRLRNPPPRYKAASDSIKGDTQHDGDWSRGLAIDLKAWARGYDPAASDAAGTASETRAAAARAVLAGLQEWGPMLEELRAAAQRPYSRFNIRYDEENTAGILLPHLAVLKRFVQVLCLRCCAELAAGQTNQALADLALAFRVTDAVKDEPILISVLVRMSEIRLLILQPIWEGMLAQQWSDDQLKELQQKLSTFDFLQEARNGFQDDRAGIGNAVIDFVRKGPAKRAEMVGLLDSFSDGTIGGPLASLALGIIPSGWFYDEQVQYNRIYDRCVLPLIDLSNRQVSPELASQKQAEVDQLCGGGPLRLVREHRLFARLIIPAVSSSVSKAARTQSDVDLAGAACALERFRLANGQYPEKLDQLVPTFLAKVPKDVIDGKTLRYERKDNRFLLYSIGWNAKDDGGEFPPKTQSNAEKLRGPGPTESEPGDWVWKYPAR